MLQRTGTIGPQRRLWRTRRHVISAVGIVTGVLAMAAPSWAGPMMGC